MNLSINEFKQRTPIFLSGEESFKNKDVYAIIVLNFPNEKTILKFEKIDNPCMLGYNNDDKARLFYTELATKYFSSEKCKAYFNEYQELFQTKVLPSMLEDTPDLLTNMKYRSEHNQDVIRFYDYGLDNDVVDGYNTKTKIAGGTNCRLWNMFTMVGNYEESFDGRVMFVAVEQGKAIKHINDIYLVAPAMVPEPYEVSGTFEAYFDDHFMPLCNKLDTDAFNHYNDNVLEKFCLFVNHDACEYCGEQIELDEFEEGPIKEIMKEKKLCFRCALWTHHHETHDKDTFIIQDGDKLNRYKGSLVDVTRCNSFSRGSCGNNFYVKLIDGEVRWINSLWYQGVIPTHMRDIKQYPNFSVNAEFVDFCEWRRYQKDAINSFKDDTLFNLYNEKGQYLGEYKYNKTTHMFFDNINPEFDDYYAWELCLDPQTDVSKL